MKRFCRSRRRREKRETKRNVSEKGVSLMRYPFWEKQLLEAATSVVISTAETISSAAE